MSEHLDGQPPGPEPAGAGQLAERLEERLEELGAALDELDTRVEVLGREFRKVLWRAVGLVALRALALFLALWLLAGLVIRVAAHG